MDEGECLEVASRAASGAIHGDAGGRKRHIWASDWASGAEPIGDVDGDGVQDILARYYQDDEDGEYDDQLYSVALFHGPVSGVLSFDDAAAHFYDPNPTDGLCRYLQLSYLTNPGDLNKDGHRDVVIGAPVFGSTGGCLGNDGMTWVFFGPHEGEITTDDADIELYHVVETLDGEHDSWSGSLVQSGHDFTGNGETDLWVGRSRGSASDEGAVAWLLEGPLSAGMELQDASHAWESDCGGLVLTHSTVAGDFDEDGFADIVLATPCATEPWSVFMAQGPLDGDMVVDGEGGSSLHLGDDSHAVSSVSGGSDANGDGRPDLVVGQGSSANNDRLDVVRGPFGADWQYDDDLLAVVTCAGTNCDNGRYTTGDLDQDGIMDVIVGDLQAHLAPDSLPDATGVYVLYGPLSGTHDVAAADRVVYASARVDGGVGARRWRHRW